VADGLAARGTYDDQAASQVAIYRGTATPEHPVELRVRSGVDPYLRLLTAQTVCTTAKRRWYRCASHPHEIMVDMIPISGGGRLIETTRVDAPRALKRLRADGAAGAWSRRVQSRWR